MVEVGLLDLIRYLLEFSNKLDSFAANVQFDGNICRHLLPLAEHMDCVRDQNFERVTDMLEPYVLGHHIGDR